MKHLHLLLVIMMRTYFLSALEVEKIHVVPEVTGYVGHDVTLPCHFTLTPEKANVTHVTQVQWDLTQPGGTTFTIVVIHAQFDKAFHESPLKGRVDVSKHSLIIKDVAKEDSGLYKCTMSTFPLGKFEGNTNLAVREQMLLSSGIISAIVAAVVLLLLILTAIAYLTFVRRCKSAARHQVHTDTAAPSADVFLPSVNGDQDVVYADVKVKMSGDRARIHARNGASSHADNVTYSEVVFSAQRVE